MTRYTLIAAAAALSMSLAAPAMAQNTNQVLKGAGIGGLVGAGVGAIVPGINPIEGAALGAAGGAAYQAATINKEKRYTYSGREFYLDKNGNRVYTGKRRKM